MGDARGHHGRPPSSLQEGWPGTSSWKYRTISIARAEKTRCSNVLSLGTLVERTLGAHMSKLDDTVQAADAVRDHYKKADAQIQAAIAEADLSIARAIALGAKHFGHVLAQGKKDLEALSRATQALDAQVTAIVSALNAARGGG